MSEECKRCKTKECIIIEGFLETYNTYKQTHYEMSSCPDKDDAELNGKKPDGIAEDKKTAEKMLIEVKQIYHSEAKNEDDTLRTKEINRNSLFDILSHRMNEIIEINNLDNKFMVTISVYNPIGRKYMGKIADVEFVKRMEEEILRKQSFQYEDEKIKIEIQENYFGTGWLGEDHQVMFSFPTCQEKGKENGMSFKDLFEMIQDYESIVNNIETYVEKKCEGKFDNYSDGKRIILFDLKFKYGMEIMLELNDRNSNMGFSFERLRVVYQRKVGMKLKEYADEVWIMHMENRDGDESIVRMIELT